MFAFPIPMAFYAATLVGVEPLAVEIEIDLSSGLPFFEIVGLPDAILRESKTRVKSAIVQSDFTFPYDQRVVLNLAPSKVRKEGSGFELGLAARILATSGQIPFPEGDTLFLGELALDGTIKSVPEMNALAHAARNMKYLVVPANSLDSLWSPPCPVVAVTHLRDLMSDEWWKAAAASPKEINRKMKPEPGAFDELEFSEFWAHHLEIAAVGRHHYLLCGPPGCGKTFFAESLRVLIQNVAHEIPEEKPVLDALFGRRPGELPWAAPHHSATAVGLVGGGKPLKPGAITRAHGGILFLDELLEFSGSVLDSLREPMEKGTMEIYRAGSQARFPSRFQLIAATNPCRCGNYKHPWKRCLCGETPRRMYRARLSGPFFNRFGVRIFCAPPLIRGKTVKGGEIRRRVKAVQKFIKESGHEETPHFQIPSDMESYRHSMNVKKLAVTLAALEQKDSVLTHHWDEARELQVIKELEDTQ